MQAATAVSAAPWLIERYEAKYRIMPEMVGPIRSAVARWCRPDSAAPDGRYRIVSLYFDNRHRRLYMETKDRAPRRFKLRVRRYVDGAYHLEIKRRIKGVIAKSRVSVPAKDWPAAFHDPRLLDHLSPARRDVAYDFVNRCLKLDARPAVLVRYEREAWVSNVDDYARITFDYKLHAAQPSGWDIAFGDDETLWRPVDYARYFGIGRSGVTLELKCTTIVPLWMSDLVHSFKLQRAGFSKYAACLEGVDRWPLDPAAGRVPARRLR